MKALKEYKWEVKIRRYQFISVYWRWTAGREDGIHEMELIRTTRTKKATTADAEQFRKANDIPKKNWKYV